MVLARKYRSAICELFVSIGEKMFGVWGTSAQESEGYSACVLEWFLMWQGQFNLDQLQIQSSSQSQYCMQLNSASVPFKVTQVKTNSASKLQLHSVSLQFESGSLSVAIRCSSPSLEVMVKDEKTFLDH
eukprot:6011999-Amphidinium_carterae.1